MKMRVKLLSEHAVIPYKAYETDLGFDLRSISQVSLDPGAWTLVCTGVAIGFPKGYGGIIKDRSSVASNRGMFVHAGVIDNDYIGEIKILMYNGSSKLQHINRGEKIAQLVLTPVVQCDILEVDDLEDTERSDGGFGSTGE